MMRISRKAKILISFVIIVSGGYLTARLIGGSGTIPADFSEARLQGALISQNIVDLSSKSAADLAKINELDKKKQFKEALELTTQVVAQSQGIREQAVALSSEIEKMTRSLSSIDSSEARQAALESITDRLALISRLINYSASLSELLDVLRGKFIGIPGNHAVSNIINQINAEVVAINSFNDQATQAMERFDDLVK